MVKLKNIFRCEAAGRENNEDNGKILQLGNNGTLLVVCDGMGGMEAGEVASALAVATIEQWFTQERLTAQVLDNPMDYLKQSIVGADTNIKNYSKNHPETEGMGSTIVLAWLIEDKVYVAWCGDSRCYRYNPQLGLERLSHDHSLVQTWVDAGQITEDQAFDHPQSNIITRSLGDPNGSALPDATEYTLYNNDVLLLCSDGLCGTLRDREIEAILSQNSDLSQCCKLLWEADEKAGWHDNVTTAMAQVVSGGAVLSMAKAEPEQTQELEIIEDEAHQGQNKRPLLHSKHLLYACISALLILAAIFAFRHFKPSDNSKEKPETETTTMQKDNIITNEEAQKEAEELKEEANEKADDKNKEEKDQEDKDEDNVQNTEKEHPEVKKIIK